MKQMFSRRTKRVLAAALLIAVILAVAGSALGFRLPYKVVQAVLQPVRAGAQALTGQAEDIYSYFFRYQMLEERVAELEAENAQLKEELRAAASLGREVELLTAALNLKTEREDFELLSANIVGWDSTDWSESFTINKGSVAGVEEGQCVITANGEVVGLVTEVGLNYSVIKSVLDSSLEISGTIASSGHNGMVQGGYATGEEGYLRMNYLPSDAVIRNNDEVVTAGSTVYPRDLVLGYVVDAGFDETGVAKYAILEPAADLGSLERVFVLTSYATE